MPPLLPRFFASAPIAVRAIVLMIALLTGVSPALATEPTLTDRAFVFGLPKAELHVHLEGTMEPELYLQIAQRNHVSIPYATPDDVRERLRGARDLPSFIRIYEEFVGALKTEQDFHDLALGYFRKAHAQGVVYAEVFVDPQLHLERGVALKTLYAGLRRAQRDARRELGMETHYILCFLRDRPAQDAARLLEDSRPWFGNLIIGVGLDNPEVDAFPEKFAPVFMRAKALGLHRTSHCDVDQPNTVAHHWGVLRLLDVERIDHGLNVLDDPALLKEVHDRRIGLTGAPTLFYTDIPGRMEYRAGAIAKLLDAGTLVTVNSDDPGMKRGLYIGDLMLRVQQTTGMTRQQMVQLTRNSFTIAWISEPRRRRYLAMVDDYIAAQEPATGIF